ncbi:MAG: hypothetical protein AAGG44_17320 [Planctomycetota bacterium]
MGLLGNFLEAFYGPGQPFETVCATVFRERKKTARGEISRRRPIGKPKTSSASSETLTAKSEVWAVLPDLVRIDTTQTNNGKTHSTVEVTRDGERLKRTPDGTVEVEQVRSRKRLSEGYALPTDFRRQFDRGLIREFWTSLILDDAGPCTVAGRDCVRIHATPIQGDKIWPHWLPLEADQFEFAADLEVPVLLTIVGLLAGEVIERIEVTDVVFNGDIEEAVFDCQPLEGQGTRPALPVTQKMSLENAAARVPFKLLLPKSGVGDEIPVVHYEPGKREDANDSVAVMYVEGDQHRLWFHLRGSSDRDSDERLEWNEIEAAGQRFEISDPEVEGGMICLRFRKHGTWVEIVSDHSRQELLDIAVSFEPI